MFETPYQQDCENARILTYEESVEKCTNSKRRTRTMRSQRSSLKSMSDSKSKEVQIQNVSFREIEKGEDMSGKAD